MPALEACLKDEDLFVRKSAAEALGKLGEHAKPVIPALTEYLEDVDIDDFRHHTDERLDNRGKLYRKCYAQVAYHLINGNEVFNVADQIW